ncbi:hypothetical protein V6N13_093189 [Hibiscus sabdariffa]
MKGGVKDKKYSEEKINEQIKQVDPPTINHYESLLQLPEDQLQSRSSALRKICQYTQAHVQWCHSLEMMVKAYPSTSILQKHKSFERVKACSQAKASAISGLTTCELGKEPTTIKRPLGFLMTISETDCKRD